MSDKTKVNTPQFRAAFPQVFRAKKNDMNGKDEFSIVALFAKGEDLTKLKEAAQFALEKKFGKDKAKWPKGLRSPFRDQADREKENDEGKLVMPQGYVKGAMYLNLRSTQRPGVVNHAVEDIIDESEFYGGCFVIASVNAYAYDFKGNVGVNFGLGNLQKVKDGDHFGNRTKATDDFKAVDAPAGDASASATDLFS